MVEIGQKNAAGTMQFNVKVAQLEQKNALLHQQLEWQPKSPQQVPQLQQIHQVSQNQDIKPQWKLFRKL